MQPIEIKSLGYKLTKQVPDSVEEFDRLAKESGAALREANRNVLYRSTLAEFRNVFLHGRDAEGDDVPAINGIDKMTGVERKYKVTKPEVKDADGKITQEEVTAWDETEDEFAQRVFAVVASRDNISIEAAQASFASHAQMVLDAVAFDPSKTERKSAGPKKTPATYLEVAKEVVAACGGSVETAIEKFSAKTGITVPEATVEALAAAVWSDQKAQKKKIAAGYAA